MPTYLPQTDRFRPPDIVRYLEARDGLLGPTVGVCRLRAAMPFGEVFDLSRAQKYAHDELVRISFPESPHG